jgi:hypothetical protein
VQYPSTADTRLSPAAVLIAVVTASALVVGVLLRLWLIFHRPLGSDEAIVGLMAGQILHGHFSAFYWGQVYGGGEAYVVAGTFAIFGSSSWALEGTAVVLSMAAAVLTWRIVLRLVEDPMLAALSGALVWAAPLTVLSNSTLEYGFRGLTMACGLGLLLMAFRILDGARSLVDFALLGLAAGIGWWSSPEITYFLLPASVLVAVAAFRAHDQAGVVVRWWPRLGVALVTASIGALPWVWANVASGWQSIRDNSVTVPVGSPDYGGRVRIVIEFMLPMLMGFRRMITGQWLGHVALSLLLLSLFLAVIALALALCLRRGLKGGVVAGAVLVMPFLMSLSPATFFWRDGRYAVFLFPLLAMALAIGASEGSAMVQRRIRAAPTRYWAAGVLSAVTVPCVILCILGFGSNMVWIDGTVGFSSAWGNPDGPTRQAISRLEASRATVGYADYWVSYRLDFLSHNALVFSPAGGEPDRWAALDHTVRSSSHQAWLFVPSTPLSDIQFSSNLEGPDGLSEGRFLAELSHLGVAYRVLDAGLVQAVIPNRPVTPLEGGLPEPL